MATLEWMFGVVASLFGVATLGWIKIQLNNLEREYQREVGWHRMWTERIMDETDASD